MSPVFLIARRHLASNLFRTTIAVGGVALGVSFMIMMSAMMTGFQTKFVRDTIESNAHVTIYDDYRATSEDFALWASRHTGAVVHVASEKPRERLNRIKKPLETLETVRRLDHVVAAAPNLVGSAILSFGTKELGASLVGIDPDSEELVVATERYMTVGHLRDLSSSGAAVVLGSGLADKLGVRRGDTLTASLRSSGARSLRVVGIFKTGITTVDNTRAYALVSLAQQILGVGRDVNRIVIRLDEYDRALETATSIERLVGYRTESWQEANANFLSIFVIQTVITYVVTGGIMIVAAFGILNILIMLVLEKYPEIAMLKSMGFPARSITLVFFLEGLAIAAIGVLAGTTGGYYMTELLGRLPLPMRGLVESEHLVMNNEPRIYVIAAAAAFLATTLASIMPAVRAGRLDPVAILRGHG